MKFLKKNNTISNFYRILSIVLEIFIVAFSIYLAYMVKFKFSPPKFNYAPFERSLPFTVIVYMAFMYIFGLVDILKKSLWEIVYSIFLTVIMLFVFTMAITFSLRGFSYPRLVILLSSVFQFVFLSIFKCLWWKLERKVYGNKNVVIIGENGENIAKKILLKHDDLYSINSIIKNYTKDKENIVEEADIVLISDDLDENTKSEIIKQSMYMNKNIFIIPSVTDIAFYKANFEQIDDVPILKVDTLELSSEQKTVKRLLDIVVAIIATVVFSPFLIILPIIIKCTDGGSPFYFQERVTDGGKKFKLVKFRSMIENAERNSGPVLVTENDSRITKIGKIMRATRLDEIPQLFNILKGDMSIVGPRPERPFYVEKFEREIPDYKYRTFVKAGLTGLAQVLGKYNTTPEDKIKYDIMYIKNYSILLDIKLIIQTVKIMFMKESTEAIKDDVKLEEILKKKNIKIKIY
ncbi:sugar transferase [Clostridium felsineum]|uniref:sugar transferase n=1 Tax=Clostridium felsineum TaxID=36839 RepID=UPI00214D64D1|nr:sugar transferase [Clostridium felsineum]